MSSEISWHVGQEVVILIDGHLDALITVDRVTSGGLPVVRGTAWRADGRERGAITSWRSRCIRPATDEDRSEMTRRRLALWAVQMVNAVRDRLTAEQSRVIIATLGMGKE